MKLLNHTDRWVSAWAGFIQRWPKSAMTACLLLTISFAFGLAQIKIATNYKVYFSAHNPEVLAYENFQSTYTKGDNFFFVLMPKEGNIFANRPLQLAAELTEQAWQLPYSTRVDSLTNFQHSRATGDDLEVSNLVSQAGSLSDSQLADLRTVAMAEPLLSGLLVSQDAGAMAINVSLKYPELSLDEVPQAAAAARAMVERLGARYPDIDILVSGTSMLNNAFAEAGLYDLLHLTPAMYLLLFVAMWVMNRSFIQAAMVMSLVLCSSIIAMGYAGFAGILMSPISFSAPVIVATISVANANHLLLAAKNNFSRGMQLNAAIHKALVDNFFAITVTALSTLLGFLAVNSSESPPLQHLGQITAVGIAAAWVLSLTLLPSLMRWAGLTGTSAQLEGTPRVERVADAIIRHRKKICATVLVSLCLLAVCMSQLRLSDDWFKYVEQGNSFRQQSDRIMKQFGLSPVEFSIPANGTASISDPTYLQNLDEFVTYLRAQPHVSHVYAVADVFKRLNKNMNGDMQEALRLPTDSETAAQFLLLYEMSLPYGLDLNDRINIDKTASRVTVMLGDVTTEQSRAFIENAENWLKTHHPSMASSATGSTVMVSMIAQRNLDSLASSTVLAVLAISVAIALLLRSPLMGLMCLVSTTLPIMAAFGVWALVEGTVGFSIAAVASISIGIIVDDTVHFLTKYTRTKGTYGCSNAEAARQAFIAVGPAIMANTAVLMLGFLSLFFSTFKLNVDMGMLTFLAIGLSMVSTFFFVTPLLAMQGRQQSVPEVYELA
ncbi:MMPL family transporter [Pseudomonas sp. OA65]|uniref:efflux RND transporter permease subunit n=1 Tax=Pseudomonas sp. OA65 TaxID=2818431 RepID=UPI001A9F288B|nr:MMPL family transporter [Pseudomonas sp. OA65]MBO1540738.1 MMPL family transporter [Pseudomonas sp. OA65]